MGKVDDRRERIYRYVVSRIEEGSPPSVREICAELSVRSTSTVHSDLKALCDRGLISMTEGLNRAIKLPGMGSVMVPLVGVVAAGRPVLAAEQIERYIPVSPELRGKELFALRVKGESMIEAAILPGDIVIVERTPEAQNGQMVVALIGDEATVKTYYRENGHFRLQPENSGMEPIIVDDVVILGRVTSVMRFLDN
ncbi:MAG: transcriptional repressor LexA [Oscillospiraceae bacterium]|jgi:repressor LexA|nr:transcriptional repressor LexA [Oscillospiraceae bacterium]